MNSGGYYLIGEGYVLWMHEERIKRELTDYKFYVNSGHVDYLYISTGLENHKTARISFLTRDWEFASFGRKDYQPFAELPPKPINLEKMIELAEYLAKDHCFLRVDFYEINGKIYFSEFTFSPCAGLLPFDKEEGDVILGEKILINV